MFGRPWFAPRAMLRCPWFTRQLLVKKSASLVLARYHRLLVLGIESSCDDTAAAIVDSSGNILADECHSQLQVHLNNGGIIPPLARDLHAKHIDNVVCSTLDSARVKIEDIDAIAVTSKPGLPLSLQVGVNYARELSLYFNKPLIPVHHMEAHATIGLLPSVSPSSPVTFPFLTLLISGGHSQIAFARSLNEFYTLGETIDDAPGEMMDKMARRLKLKNLGEPFDRISGGAAIELLAKNGNPLAFGNLGTTVPLSKIRSCDFSFSGLKNFFKHIAQLEKKHKIQADQVIPEAKDMAASIQLLTTVHILKRLSRALRFIEMTRLDRMSREDIMKLTEEECAKLCPDFTGDRGKEEIAIPLIVSGGVASSDFITSAIVRFCHAYRAIDAKTIVRPVVPRPKNLCCDNGIMIAVNGMLKLLAQVTGSHFTTGRANDGNGRERTDHACDQLHESICVTGDTWKKDAPIGDTITDIHTANEEEAHEYALSGQSDSSSRIKNESSTCTTSSSLEGHEKKAKRAFDSLILTSKDEICSFKAEPKARLGVSLQRAVVAAHIKADPIKLSLVLGTKDSSDSKEYH